jgi:hypothetical protein
MVPVSAPQPGSVPPGVVGRGLQSWEVPRPISLGPQGVAEAKRRVKRVRKRGRTILGQSIVFVVVVVDGGGGGGGGGGVLV